MDIPAPQKQSDRVPRELLPSILFIVIANLLPAAGVLWYDWSVFALLVLFWIENIITGLFHVPRIVLAQGAGSTGQGDTDGNASLRKRVETAAFFCLHYGLFAFGHGMIVFNIMADDPAARYGVGDILSVFHDYGLYWAVLFLFISEASCYRW